MQSEKDKELSEEEKRKKRKSRKIKFYTIIVSFISLWALLSNDIINFLNINKEDKYISEDEMNSLGRINANFKTIIEKLEIIKTNSAKISPNESNKKLIVDIRDEFFAIEFLIQDLYSQYEKYLISLNEEIENKNIKNISKNSNKEVLEIKNLYNDISETDNNIREMANEIKKYIKGENKKLSLDEYIENVKNLYIKISNNISDIVIGEEKK